MIVAIYLRVSTRKKKDVGRGKDNPFEQDPEVQLAPLKKFCEFRGWDIFQIYTDRITGSKNDREEYQQLWADAKRGNFKAVLVWRFDRFARTTLELIRSLDEFAALGIDFVSSTENIDTTTPMGKAMFTMIAAFAELERSTTIERIREGIAHAQEKGTKSGKPIGRPKAVFRRDRAIEMLLEGQSYRQIAHALGTSIGAVQRATVGVSKPKPQALPFPPSNDGPLMYQN